MIMGSSNDTGKIVLWIIGILIAAVAGTAGFLFGRWSERARTERKLYRIKKKVFDLSNKSAKLNSNLKKLIFLCSTYEMILEKASKSEKKEVRSLQEKYWSLSSILREFGVKDSQIQLIKTKINKERHNLKLIGDFV